MDLETGLTLSERSTVVHVAVQDSHCVGFRLMRPVFILEGVDVEV